MVNDTSLKYIPAMQSWKLTTEQDSAWRTLLHTSTRLLSRLDEEMKAAHNERLSDFDVLSNLAEAPSGKLRMSDLADQTLFSRSRLSYTVAQLEARGLVKRRKDPHDKRGITAELTPAGRSRHRQLARTHIDGIRSHFLAVTDPRIRSELTELLTPILHRLEANDETDET